jgi:hypothetical protein
VPYPIARRLALLCLLLAPAAHAQGLPAYRPINPVAAARTPLGFEPYREPGAGPWSADVALDYANAIEHADFSSALYDLDTEVLRLRVGVRRRVGARAFVGADAALGGAYAGFLDGFLDWYHGLLGIDMPERDRRPHDAFLYRLEPPDGELRTRRPVDAYFGDLRLAAGMQVAPHVQTVATVTLPTSTAPDGYGLGVLGGGVVTTVSAPIAGPVLIYEGSLGVGYTPRHGDLSDYQRTTFFSGSSGLRWRFWGRQSLYGNLFVHSPYYHDTTVPSLDRRDVAFDFGWILATQSGQEWRVGMTEDPEPGGPGVDLVFRLGLTFRPAPR